MERPFEHDLKAADCWNPHRRCLVSGSSTAASTGSRGPPSSQNGPILTQRAAFAPLEALPPGLRGGFSRSLGVIPLPNARRMPFRIFARPSLAKTNRTQCTHTECSVKRLPLFVGNFERTSVRRMWFSLATGFGSKQPSDHLRDVTTTA